ncbi:ArnT family glycosyltransferase [Rubrobacter indicoceani]|uniref:ArnT family glycosyltransferase n=1 Tax=Rubrobacter indicoceani TaxID=2051957 RepID=UPI000E5B4BB4|nr:hypothetical protein [Rubrobacter indicoceani]
MKGGVIGKAAPYGVLAPLSVLVVAAAVYVMYGFDGPLYRDYGIYLYGGQMMAGGVPPYAGIFDHKGPMPVFLSALGVVLSGLFGTDDLITVRAVFFGVGCLAALSVYWLGRSVFNSRMVGLFAALIFVGFQAYSVGVASGPEPKTPLVLFQVLALALMVHRRWLLAGLCGALAFLTWQPAGILLAVGFLTAVFGAGRFGAASRFAGGAAIPLAVTLAYYLYSGALREFLEGFLVFNLLRVSRGGEQPYENIRQLVLPISNGYDFMALPALVGLVTLLVLCILRLRDHRFTPLLLSLPLFGAWSLVDFQVSEDFYIFLPYAAVGLGAGLALLSDRFGGRFREAVLPAGIAVGLVGAAVVGGPFVDKDATPGPSLQEQERSAEQITARFGENATIVSINAPQVLALIHEKNPNPYLFITDGIDRQVDATYPGGFTGWIENLEEQNPDAIAYFADAQRQMPFNDLTPENRRELQEWLETGYSREEKVGNFWFYVRD